MKFNQPNMSTPLVQIKPVEAIKFGWTATNRQLWLLIGMGLLMAVIGQIPNLFGFDQATLEGGDPTNLSLFAGVNFIIGIIGALLGLGFMKSALKLADGQTIILNDLFSQSRVLLKYIFGAILLGLAVAGVILTAVAIYSASIFILNQAGQMGNAYWTIGLTAIIGITLFVVLVILSIRWSLFPYIIIDRELGPIAALKLSWKLTDGNTLPLFKFFILAMLVGLLGVLALLVGYLVAMPVITIAMAHIYRQLSTDTTV